MNEQANIGIKCVTHKTRTLKLWTLAWLVSLALATFGPKFLWDANTVLSIIAVIVNLAMGTGMMFANKQHLNSLDEMQQKIQTDAMAITLGAGLILACSYETISNIGLVSFDASISHLIMVMALIYLGSVITIGAKYR